MFGVRSSTASFPFDPSSFDPQDGRATAFCSVLFTRYFQFSRLQRLKQVSSRLDSTLFFFLLAVSGCDADVERGL